MKKSQGLFLLLVLLLVAAFLAAVQFWIKPAIERDVAVLINETLKAQGLTPKNPVSVSVSPLTRTLVIPAFDLSPNSTTGLQKGRVQPSETIMTYQGLLAFSPLRDLFTPKTGPITLVQQSLCQGLSMEINGASVSMENLVARELGADAQELRSLLSDPNFQGKRPPLFALLIRVEHFLIDVPTAKTKIVMGPMLFDKLTPSKLESLSIENIQGFEQGVKRIHSSRLLQKNIRIFTEEEALNLAAKLSQASEAARTEELVKLFIGEKPLIESTSLQGVTIDVEGSPVNIKEIAFTTTAGKEERITITGLSLAGKTIEEQVGQKLPIPALLHLNVALGESQQADQTRKLTASVSIDELFALDGELTASLDNLENLFAKLLTCPLRDFSLRLTDKSLLARCALYFAPEAPDKELILEQIRKNMNSSPLERDLAEKLCTFVSKPGVLKISTKPGKTFTAAELDALNETTIGELLELSVSQGQEDLNQTMTRLKSE
ncbi:MAG: hypothetical protein K6G15_02440 [Desulfovibrio sp.]|nr:hypothetical protein [Desulfovibrio sp.]